MAHQSVSLALTTGAFAALANKKGKVTVSSEKTAHALNLLSGRAVIGAALDGKGAIGKQARMAIRTQAVTLDGLLCQASLDGAQWGDLLGLLVAEFGVAHLNRTTMRGKAGAVAYMAQVVKSCELKFDGAETGKVSERAALALIRAQDVQVGVSALYAAAEAARIEAAAAAAAAEAEATAAAAAEAEA